MNWKRLAIASIAGILGTLVLATTATSTEKKPAHVESKSTVAAPVDSKSTTATPVHPHAAPAHPATPSVPDAPDTSDASDTPDTPDAPDAPGILQPGHERVGVGQDITIAAGDTHDGDVVCVGGHVTVNGHVNGNVTVVGGRLDLRGSVDGDVTGVASRMDIDPAAKINGGLTNVCGSLHRNNATVQGQVVNIPFGITFPTWGEGFHPGLAMLSGVLFWWRLFALFLFFVCALLVTALVPDRIRLISEEAPHRLFTAFVFGLIGYFVFACTEVFLFFTLIGIPLVMLFYLVFVVLKWMAMCGIFHQIGARMGRAMGREMSLLGGMFLGFLPFALLRFIPMCIGISIWFLVEILAFGYLILTKVGTRGSFGPVAIAVPPTPPMPPPSPGPMEPDAGPVAS